jgi:hypothetical protein
MLVTTKIAASLKTNFIVITHIALNIKVGSVPHCAYLLHYVVQCTPEKERTVMKYTANSLTISLQSEENNYTSSALYY